MPNFQISITRIKPENKHSKLTLSLLNGLQLLLILLFDLTTVQFRRLETIGLSSDIDKVKPAEKRYEPLSSSSRKLGSDRQTDDQMLSPINSVIDKKDFVSHLS